MNAIVAFIQKRKYLPITIILGISLVLQVWYSMKPLAPWWDTAIYVNMGKYIYSHGTVGMFEIFRPILLPLVYGFVWKIGINPYVFGKVLAIIFSLATIFITYLVGEKIYKKAGIYASLLLAFLPIFFAFAVVPLSDIPSTFFTVLAVYFFISKKNILAGVSIGLAFLLRFPQVLILFPLGLAALVYTKNIKSNFFEAFKIGLGFFIVTLPYFILNIVLYKDPFLPVLLGNQVAIVSGTLMNLSYSYFYYFTSLFVQSPFIIFSLIFVFIFLTHYKKLDSDTRKNYLAILLPLILIASYFSYIQHKELRYSIAFLPFLFIASGFGISYGIDHIKNPNKKVVHVITACVVFIISIHACYLGYTTYLSPYLLSPQSIAYYHYFDNTNAAIMTPSPQFGLYSDVYIAELGDTWEHLLEAYPRQKNLIEYLTIDNCGTSCTTDPENCKLAQDQFLALVKKENTEVLHQTAGYCTYQIYKRN